MTQLQPTTSPKPAARTYDLVVVTAQPSFVFKHANRGVTVGSDTLSWTKDGATVSVPLHSIRTIRMQSGGDWRNETNMCQISFADAPMLTVMDVATSGIADPAQLPIYRAFVRDLHKTLVRGGHAPRIAFLAGYSEGRYTLILICAILLGLIGVGGPLVLLMFFVRNMQVLGALAAGSVLVWPLAIMVRNNTPRNYDPSRPPGELME